MKYRHLLTFLFIGLSTWSIAQSSADSIKAETAFARGMELFQARNYEASITHFEEAADLFGEDYLQRQVKTLEKIGYAYTRQMKLNESIEVYRRIEPLARKVLDEFGDHKPLQSQQMMMAVTLGRIQQGDNALPYFDETIRMIKTYDNNPGLIANLIGFKARIFLDKGDFEQSANLMDQALEMARESKNSRGIIRALRVSSGYYHDLGNYEKARQLCDEVIELGKKEYGEKGIGLVSYYALRARIAIVQQEYEMALQWTNQALAISVQHPNGPLNDIGYNHYLQGTVYLQTDELEKALAAFDTAWQHFNKQSSSTSNHLSALESKLLCLSYLKRNNEGQDVHNEINELLKNEEVSIISRANSISTIGIYFRNLGLYENAAKYFDDAISILQTEYQAVDLPLANIYYEYSVLELERENVEKADEFIAKAIEINKIEIEDEVYVINDINHINFIQQKASILKTKGQLTEALDVIVEAIDYTQKDKLSAIGSKFVTESIFDLRNIALEICFDLYSVNSDQKYLKLAFELGELAKSQQLFEWISEAVNSKQGLLDSTLLVQRQTLSNKINTYQKLLTSTDSIARANRSRFTDSLFFFQSEKNKLTEQIKKMNPQLYGHIYENMRVNFDDVIGTLKADEQLVSYQLLDSSMIILIAGGQNHMLKVYSANLSELISQLSVSLSNPDDAGTMALSGNLYKILIEPIEAYLTQSNINIIPDGVLAYLPFELLSKNDEYLFLSKNIRYSYAAHTLLQPINTSNNRQQLIAFAPDFNQNQSSVVRSELSKLPGALEEVKTIGEIYQGTSFTQTQATESNFKANASGNDLIHLATHAVVDDLYPDQSKLIFEFENDSTNDGFLHAYEIYNLNLNAQLVTLSACNTGFGQIKKGEGVMSLSRAFAYAGVPSSVVSLWPASDKSTPELMKYFYQNLEEGQAKDMALNNARKSYLATATGKARHPFYWGGFVLIGDNSPIQTDSSNVAIILSILFLITALPIVIVIKQKYLKLEDN